MLHVPVFATNDAHERFCRAVIERAGMVTHAQTKAGLERRALEAIQRLGFREAETLTVNGDFQRADSFRKSIRANMLHREKIRLWGPVRAREPSVVHTVSVDLSRFQQMTLPSTLSSGPYETAASVRARGAWQPPPEVATTVQVPENYGAAMDHTGAHYDRCLREIFSLMSLFSTQKKWRKFEGRYRLYGLFSEVNPRFMDTLLELSLRGFLPHPWITLEQMQDSAGMTWEDVDEAAGVWASFNCVEIANGSVRLLKDEKDF